MKTQRLRLGLVATLWVAALVIIGGAVYSPYFAERGPLRPDFTMPDLDGQPHRIGDYAGQVVMINFWASWCAPCRREMPLLIAAQERFGDQGLQIMGVAVDHPRAARAFARNHDTNYPILIGTEQAAKIQDQYTGENDPPGVLPYTVILNRNGRIVQRIAGQLHSNQIARIIRPLLHDNSPKTP